ncbi:bifunctional glutamate N-acetyltransferase/amino-acid acetyltransferase ArgJ [Dissulfurimicrobium hydrothermale]|uniref:bifunctional glutamate N-acetyltransferase/amino-acid acetyltransferase ArgJ n=1 Tax=Dissulfurimicrobium hydrothermale TaxID=1750598 RepID=UPI001EDB0EDB|nr:bifunctional glutamate N-acetyltransferase/amino-acid acetyltransferase ArgJ [Dissulfurimicrobium hydrothermale]UKL14058.1 bifunctional glutamate N-acetyltransferase/amino-acid acetyltransferase ArgJ [Dissulfurimicrobium hydrothermale]
MRVTGFLGSAVEAGIKHKGRLDLGLILSERPAVAAAVFTRNEVKAAPVIAGIRRMATGNPYVRAVVVNSGNANACTGLNGLQDVETTKLLVGRALNIDPEDILVSSTGVIGKPMPMDRITNAIHALIDGLDEDRLDLVAQAILTTDSMKKTAVRDIKIDGVKVRIAGMAKGAGMIAPMLAPPQATMLAFILTDADITPTFARETLNMATKESFNRILIDGDTSTNDTVFFLANGLAGNHSIENGRWGDAFNAILKDLMQELARLIVADGEGATKLVTIIVKGARNHAEADVIARTIATSPLVKTALFGNDPNWGRILAAAGRAGFALDQDRIALTIGGVEIVRGGVGIGEEAEVTAKGVMAGREYEIRLDLGLGEAEARVLTSDLSVEYVRINADYRT